MDPFGRGYSGTVDLLVANKNYCDSLEDYATMNHNGKPLNNFRTFVSSSGATDHERNQGPKPIEYALIAGQRSKIGVPMSSSITDKSDTLGHSLDKTKLSTNGGYWISLGILKLLLCQLHPRVLY